VRNKSNAKQDSNPEALLFEPGDIPRWIYGRILGRPMNFSFIDEHVAGSAGPLRKREVDWLREKKQIEAILSVREGPLVAGWVEGLHYLNIPVRNHFPPTIEQLNKCVNFIIKETSLGKKTAVHCFVPSTTVGSICPADIAHISGRVFAADGLLHNIVGKFEHEYNGTVIEIQARGTLPITCTPNHKFLIYRPYRTPRGIGYKPNWVGKNHRNSLIAQEWHDKQPTWVEAKDIALGDFLLSPIPKFRLNPLGKLRLEWKSENGNSRELKIPEQSKDLAWLFGLYAADGSSIGPRGLQIVLGKNDDVERAVKAFSGFGVEPVLREKENYTRVTVFSRTLTYNFRLWFGTTSFQKRLPDFIFEWDTDSVLEGVTDGDAYYSAKRNYTAFLSTSQILAQQIWHLSLSKGNFPYIRRYKRVGGFGNACPAWMVEWREGRELQHYTSKWQSYYCLPVVSIGKAGYTGPVYNLEVEENPTYLANGVIVHNCAAGRGRTGTVLAAYLCYKYGLNANEAIRQVRLKRPGSIERNQEAVIHEYSAGIKDRPKN
jgi:intein/homing endonuclease